MHTENKDEMRERIIEAALRRFTHYSASKTTMTEIAEDLSCSKASLYYYFPDKKSVHLAVISKIGDYYLAALEKEAGKVESAVASLENVIAIRNEFIQRFCRLELFKLINDEAIKVFHDEIREAKNREMAVIVKIISKGIEKGEFKAVDPEETANLLFHAWIGLRYCFIQDMSTKITEDLDEEQAKVLVQRQKQLLKIFVEGLKK